MKRKPKIIALYNENPDWPASDKESSARVMNLLATALDERGYDYRLVKIFDSLSGLDPFDPREWLVWNWAEELGGQPWTDAAVAAELERRGFVFTGSSSAALILSCDRMKVKQRLREAGLPTLPARVFADPLQAEQWDAFPAIVKGAHQHGSFGIDSGAIVYNAEQFARRIAFVREALGDESLAEPFLDSREFHVTVFGNGSPEALPPTEYDYSAFADMHDRMFKFQWKFDETAWGYHAVKLISPSPADDPQLRERLEQGAVQAYQAMGIADYGRVDMRMLGDEPQVLDVNPNPDIDPISALIASAKACGMSYADVVERIIGHAVDRMM